MELTLSGLRNRCGRLHAKKKPGTDIKASLQTFRIEKRRKIDVDYVAHVDSLSSKQFRKWRQYIKRFVSYQAILI